MGAFAELAVTSGVRRLVLLSGRGEAEARRAEQAVRDSGADWTILRCELVQPELQRGLPARARARAARSPCRPATCPSRSSTPTTSPTSRSRRSPSDGHVGQLYELTGPRLLTFAEAAAEIAKAAGREIRYVPVSVEEYATAAAEQGVPDEVIDLLTYLFSEVLDGRNAHLADGVQRALGREPRDFADYARDAAATGVWDPPPADRGGVMIEGIPSADRCGGGDARGGWGAEASTRSLSGTESTSKGGGS